MLFNLIVALIVENFDQFTAVLAMVNRFQFGSLNEPVSVFHEILMAGSLVGLQSQCYFVFS